MLHPKQKKYWEMSPLEKQYKYKDLSIAGAIKSNHDEIYQYSMELKQQREKENQEKEMEKLIIQAIEEQVIQKIEKMFK